MTQGIPDVYAKLSEIIGAPVNLSAVQEVTRSPQEDGRSFVGMLLKRLSPDGFTATVDQADLIQGLLEALHHGWVSEAGPGMRHGVWEHFKGNLYCSLGVGLNTETDAQEVEYLSMDGTKFHRRCEQWNEVVQWPDGKYRSRFVWRGSPYSRPRSQSPSVRYTPIVHANGTVSLPTLKPRRSEPSSKGATRKTTVKTDTSWTGCSCGTWPDVYGETFSA